MGSNSLGCVLVMGYSLVPDPAAGITPFLTLCIAFYAEKRLAKDWFENPGLLEIMPSGNGALPE
jgi:hypothetical protein